MTASGNKAMCRGSGPGKVRRWYAVPNPEEILCTPPSQGTCGIGGCGGAKFLAEVIDLLLDGLWRRRKLASHFQISDRAVVMFLLLLEPGKVHDDLFEDELIGLFVGLLLFVPTAHGQLPDVASACALVVILVINSTQ